MKKLIVASNNKGKIAEIKEMLKDKFEVFSLNDVGVNIDVEETGETFFDNALLKAKAVYDLTKMYSLSDDSGICVEALDGGPGVYSARFAGLECDDKKNNDLLLQKLKDVENRAARFKSSVVLYFGENNYIEGFGETQGSILQSPQGENGFGYDSLFYSDELKKSFGLALPHEKNQISHRRRALEDLIKKINSNEQ